MKRILLIAFILNTTLYYCNAQERVPELFDKIENVTEIDFYAKPFVRILEYDSDKNIYYDSLECLESANIILSYLYEYIDVPRKLDSSYCDDALSHFKLGVQSVLKDNRRSVDANFVNDIGSTKMYSCFIFHDGINYRPKLNITSKKVGVAIGLTAMAVAAATFTGYGFFVIPTGEAPSRSTLTLVVVSNASRAIIYKHIVPAEMSASSNPVNTIKWQIEDAYKQLLENIFISQRYKEGRPKRNRKKDYY